MTAFAIGGPIARADLPGLCDRVCALLRESGATVVDLLGPRFGRTRLRDWGAL